MEAAWIEGIAAMARAGAGSSSMKSSSVGGLTAAMAAGIGGSAGVVGRRPGVTVRLPQAVRSLKAIGMAVSEADLVHRGMVYDLEVDTANAESLERARIIAAHVR